MYLIDWREECCDDRNCDRTEGFSDTRNTRDEAIALAELAENDGAWDVRVQDLSEIR